MNKMDEAEGMPQQIGSCIDLQAALAMAGGDVGLLRELAGAFLDEVPRVLNALRSALDQRDSDAIQNAAHQLQGIMRCLHAERARRQAVQLEMLSQQDTGWQAASQLLTDLNSTIHSAMEALTEFLASTP